MKKQLSTLATMILVTLLVVSLSEAQVATFRMVEDPPSPPPHDIDAHFFVEFRVDAAVHAGDPLKTMMLYVQFTGGTIEVANPSAPFSDIHSGFNFTQTNAMDGADKLLLKILSSAGVAAADDILIARVEFIQTAVGPSHLDYLTDPPPAEKGTRYSLASAPTSPIVPIVEGTDVCLPVLLSAFTVVPATEGVMVKWRTESEINNLGFDIYRSGSLDGTFAKVNKARIKGAGTDATPHSYQFIDEGVEVGNTYYYYIEDVSYSGERNRSHIIRVTVDATGKLKVVNMAPLKFALFQNFPNPFNPETWVPYQLAQDAFVTVRIYNLKGQLIRTIALGQKSAGTYLTRDRAVYWDGRDNIGAKVVSGMYFYTLQAGKFMATQRMVVIE
jgi:hypothetical protein